MLRRLEKGLNNAKMKSQIADSVSPSTENRHGPFNSSTGRLGQFSPVNVSQTISADVHHGSMDGGAYNGTLSGSSTVDEDEGDGENPDEGMYPAKLIKKEKQRNSFFGTVLGPSGVSKNLDSPYVTTGSPAFDRCASYPPDGGQMMSVYPTQLDDPVRKGLMDEKTAENIIDMVLIRLNPFINLFDPELHSASYIRNKCPFLFTTLLMAGSKFFKPHLYIRCRQLADQHAIAAFAEARKSVEIVQAFMCLTYWKEPDDTVCSPVIFDLWTHRNVIFMIANLDLHRICKYIDFGPNNPHSLSS